MFRNLVRLARPLACSAAIIYIYHRRDKLLQTQCAVFSWGWSNFGQLGLGNSINSYLPQNVTTFDSKTVICVSCRASASAAVCSDGLIYTWGKSKGGVLGHQNQTETNVNIPTLVDSLKNTQFVSVTVGNNHMAAISTNGELYTWGNPDHGKLGHSYQVEDMRIQKDHYHTKGYFNRGALPAKVEIPGKVIQVACGAQHTICLTELGDVYIWGLNKKGVLGFNSSDLEVAKPTKLNLNQKIKKVDAGSDFSLALTEDGKYDYQIQTDQILSLLAWGSNYFGQLGSPSPLSFKEPALVNGFTPQTKIQDFSCGEQFVGAIDQNGRLFTWGYGSDGQLGHSTRQDIPVPSIVDFNQKVRSISCGIGHVGIITESFQLYMFGRGKEGQLGRGTEIESPNAYKMSPALVEYLKGRQVIQVACGGSHTLAIVN